MAAYDDPRVKPHVRAAAAKVRDTFGITDIGGFATTGHISNSDHYTGLAIDVMGALKGQQVANWAQANAKSLCITYIIWNRQIWDSRNSKGWVPYHGTSPHTDHVHISFFPTCQSDGSTSNSPTAAPSSADPQGCMKLIASLFGF